MVNLSYSPKVKTLKRKFGSLPITYTRSRVESPEELKILENLIKKFQFNLDKDESPDELTHNHQQILPIGETGSSSSSSSTSANPTVELVSSDEEENDEAADLENDDNDDEFNLISKKRKHVDESRIHKKKKRKIH